MADFETELNKAILDALTGDAALMAELTGGVHDHVRQGTAYPYSVIDEIITSNGDTKDANGFEPVVHIHTWSKYRGKKELRKIMGLIYNVLQDSELPMANHSAVFCYFDGSESFREDNGITRHGVQRFRLFVEAI